MCVCLRCCNPTLPGCLLPSSLWQRSTLLGMPVTVSYVPASWCFAIAGESPFFSCCRLCNVWHVIVFLKIKKIAQETEAHHKHVAEFNNTFLLLLLLFSDSSEKQTWPIRAGLKQDKSTCTLMWVVAQFALHELALLRQQQVS